MKKISLFFLTFFISLTIANAQGCNVISGTGKNVGDEVVCGTEHFYVISNDGENVKMLAKYNLMAGETHNYLEINGFSSTNRDDIYSYQPVKDLLDEGYYYSYSDYEYDSST